MGVMDEIMTAPSGRWFKFTQIGDVVTGEIVGIVERQVLEYGTRVPLTWADGAPQLEVLFSLSTGKRDDEDDDGVRVLRIKGWGIQRNALRDACQRAGKVPEVGDRMSGAYVGVDGAAKVYVYQVHPADKQATHPYIKPEGAALPVKQPEPDVVEAWRTAQSRAQADEIARNAGWATVAIPTTDELPF